MSDTLPEERDPGSGADLWVIGNVLIDLMMKGVAEIPRWGEEVLAGGRSEQIGGQGANLARAAARFGMSTVLASVVGSDQSGAEIRSALEDDGVNRSALKIVEGRTALAVAAVRPDGERAFITDLGCSATFDLDDLTEFSERIHSSRALALVGTSNLPGIDLASAGALMADARRHGVITLFDPGWGPEIVNAGQGLDGLLRATDVFLPNRDEATALTDESDITAILMALRERCLGRVIVTCGEEGSATLDGETLVIVQPLPVIVDNAVGAGDVFAAGVISGLIDDGDVVGAMIRGTAAAASYISRREQRYAGISGWRDLAADVTVRRL